MKNKKAVIILDLVDESIQATNDKIAQEIIDWLRNEAVSIPWVKEVKAVTIH